MKKFIIVPTYNEQENIAALLDEIVKYCPDAHVLVVDDDSPDGTWKIVQEKALTNPQVHLLHRKTDRGRGSAGIAGYLYALQHGADIICEMDADFSHHPSYLPHFFKALEDREYHMVSGCRFIQGGDDSNRGWIRRFITFLANIYVRSVLKIKLRDCSSGFRCFRREILESIGIENMEAKGPAITQEVLFRALQLGFKILEIPIVFRDRQLGKTKLSYRELMGGILMVLRLRFSKAPDLVRQNSLLQNKRA